MVDYNQEYVVKMYNGIKMKVIDGPVSEIQCLKKLVKCFEYFDCSGGISRTREDKNL